MVQPSQKWELQFKIPDDGNFNLIQYLIKATQFSDSSEMWQWPLVTRDSDSLVELVDVISEVLD